MCSFHKRLHKIEVSMIKDQKRVKNLSGELGGLADPVNKSRPQISDCTTGSFNINWRACPALSGGPELHMQVSEG